MPVDRTTPSNCAQCCVHQRRSHAPPSKGHAIDPVPTDRPRRAISALNINSIVDATGRTNKTEHVYLLSFDDVNASKKFSEEFSRSSLMSTIKRHLFFQEDTITTIIYEMS